jgi:hypothetical protein
MGKEKGDSRQEGKTNKWPTILGLVIAFFYIEKLSSKVTQAVF